MTYLELVQRLQLESGLGGSPIQSFSGLRGMSLRLVGWVAEANLLLQSRWTDWNFLWAIATPIVTADGVSDYAPNADLNAWIESSLSIDGDPIEYREYDPSVPLSATKGRPYTLYRLPNRQVRFYPTPDRDYTLKGEYHRKPVELSGESDRPIIPAHFHMAIVWQALWLYANFDNAAETKVQAQEQLSTYITAMESQELPGSRLGHRQSNAGIIEVRAE